MTSGGSIVGAFQQAKGLSEAGFVEGPVVPSRPRFDQRGSK